MILPRMRSPRVLTGSVLLGDYALRSRLEQLALEEDVRDEDPKDEESRLQLAGRGMLQLQDPMVGGHLDGIVELEPLDEDGDLSQGLQVHDLGTRRPRTVHGIQDDLGRASDRPPGSGGCGHRAGS